MVSAKDGMRKQHPTCKPNIPSTTHTTRIPITYQSEDQIPILFANRSRTHELGRKLRKVYKASPSSRSPGGRSGRVREGLVEADDDEEGKARVAREERDDVDLLSVSPSFRRTEEWKRTGSGGALPLDGDVALSGDPSYDSPTRAPLLGRVLYTFAGTKRKTPSTPGASQSPESVKRVRFSPVVDDTATAPETPTKKTPTRTKPRPGPSPLSRSVRTPPKVSPRPAAEDPTPTKPTRRISSRLSGAEPPTNIDENVTDNALSRSELSRERRRLRNERVMRSAGVVGYDAVGGSDEEDVGEDKESDEDSGSGENESGDEEESDSGSGADEEERRATDGDDDDFVSSQPAHERYFQLSGPSSTPIKNRTSNTTLASLPSLSHADYTRILPFVPPNHARERARLVSRHTRQFPQWHHELLQGFSVAVYGFGSKRGLLNEFAEYVGKASGSPVAIFNAFESGVSVKTVVGDLVDGICRAHLTSSGKKLPRTLPAQLALLRSWFGDKPDPSLPYTHLYIVLHNIDAPGLRSDRSQDVLSHLAAFPCVHLACSVDHVEAGLLWDGRKHARFRFAWHDCATFEPYDVEARDVVGSLGVVAPEIGAGGKGLKGLVWVMRSLQANVRRIFGVAVKAMMEKMDGGVGGGGGGEEGGGDEDAPEDDDSGDSDDQQSKKRFNSRRPGRPGVPSSSSASTHPTPSFAIPFSDLFSLCRDQFLASSEQTFRTQLREFLDHGLLRVGRGLGGAEVVWVPAGRKELEKVEGVVKEMG